MSAGLDGFRPEVRAALERLLAASHTPGAVATLDLDNTCVHHDTGEAVFHSLCREGRLDLEAVLAAPGVWESFTRDPALPDPRPLVRACLDDPRRLPAAAKGLVRAYWALLERLGKETAYAWCAFLLTGLREDEVRSESRRVLAAELARPLGQDRLEDRPGDPEPVLIAAGLRPYAPMQALVRALRAAGIEPWIVSASNRWTVEVFAGEHLGIPPERVIGVRPRVVAGRVSAALDPEVPLTVGPGKVEAIRRLIGRLPVLAAGDSGSDWEMLCASTGLALVIDHGDPGMRRRVAGRPAAGPPRFLLQPRFIDPPVS
ncbi:MAG TPA: haloacid dehalogenase-like hydrolase [Myxococcota bacterium]|nr:haloacid dehalogenase-like hydrolase [Myxococcota bacterium]HRY92338.1 haloacid dehalogenase-like hydrolase [Myxococcota bacterium]HSA23980.1 haloacid dehalogenase-like hydrolase [Myxococcota bacterium]